MAKKKKKKPIPPEVKLKRKIKKYTKRTLIILAIALGYFKLLPQMAPNYAPQVKNNEEQLIAFLQIAKKQVTTLLGSAIEFTDKLATDKESLENIDPEEIVSQKVEELKDKVKTLPQEQVKKIKRDFCSEVIEEEINSTGSSEEN